MSDSTEYELPMDASDSKLMHTIGFMTVAELPERGLVGGYLVLNTGGRPLEFHCTAPVKASRAQEILYGPTLRPYLYGEQIGRALLAKAKHAPEFIGIDAVDVMAVRPFAKSPVVYVIPAPLEPESTSTEADRRTCARPMVTSRVDQQHQLVRQPMTARLVEFSLGTQRVAVSSEFVDDRETVSDRLHKHADGFDLFEPFQRIHEAIQEAHTKG
jgi:hypothetical protein